MDGGERLAAIERNRAKLNACRRHRFNREIPGIEDGIAAMFGQKMTCANCEGEISLVELNQYVRGYEAAGGNGNDVIPGWRNEEPKRKYFGQSPDER